MYDEETLRQRIESSVRVFVHKHNIETNEGRVGSLVDILCKLFNEHSKATKILNSQEKDRIKRLEKTLDFRKRQLERRDNSLEQEKRNRFGDKYVDFINGDITSMEWVLKFVKEHSV